MRVIAGGDATCICMPQWSSGLCQAVSIPWSQHYHIKQRGEPCSPSPTPPPPPGQAGPSPALLSCSAFTPAAVTPSPFWPPNLTAFILTFAILIPSNLTLVETITAVF